MPSLNPHTPPPTMTTGNSFTTCGAVRLRSAGLILEECVSSGICSVRCLYLHPQAQDSDGAAVGSTLAQLIVLNLDARHCRKFLTL